MHGYVLEKKKNIISRKMEGKEVGCYGGRMLWGKLRETRVSCPIVTSVVGTKDLEAETPPPTIIKQQKFQGLVISEKLPF